MIRNILGRRLLRIFSALLLALLLPFLLGAGTAQQAKGGKYLVYIGTYTDHGSKGIYVSRFDSTTGQLTPPEVAAETVQPSFLAAHPNERFLYAVNEIEDYKGQPAGEVGAFTIDSATGKLSALNQVSSRDRGPAHIALDRTGKYVLVANYSLGSVAVLPVLADGRLGELTAFVQHKGSSVDKERQEGPHAHAIAFSPDNRFAVVADLGLDQVISYPFDAAKGTLGKPTVTKTDPGAGPRHLAFGPDGKFLYVINEMASTIAAYSYDTETGALHPLQTISTLPKGYAASSSNTTAEIEVHPSGKFLYGSNRGHDSIAAFAIDPAKGTLTLLGFYPTGGKTPRHFAIDPTGSWLLAENQDTNNIAVFRVDAKTGELSQTGQVLDVPSPVCVKFVPVH